MRLIDADALLASIPNVSLNPFHAALEAICEAPTIDAVPVVRCKGCKNWGTDWVLGETEHVKCCNLAEYMVGANGYCIYGEVKE